MPCEIVGLHFYADSSELRPIDSVFNTQFAVDYAIAHEEAGFDRVLIGQTATWPDGFAIASHITAVTSKLKFMVAHRPGFIAPTMAARMFATLDQLSGGRAGVHIITGASDKELECDGDFTSKEERYLRSREYINVLRMMWENNSPVDFKGDWYQFNQAFSKIKPVQDALPVFWGGASDIAVKLGAESADVYAIGPGTLEQTRTLINKFKSRAAEFGRHPGISMSVRIIVGETTEEAWQKAEYVLERVTQIQRDGTKIGRDKGKDDLAASHLLALASQGECLDSCLWTGVAKATEGRLQAMALVGTAEEVSDALLEYYRVGVDRFLINGFDTIHDVKLFGRKLIPMIKQKVSAEDARR